MGPLTQALATLLVFQAPLSFATPIHEPCAKVAAIQLKQKEANPTRTRFEVPAHIALSCLKSIPFNQKNALSFLDGVPSFWDWQSTKDFLPNPPKGYQVPGTDFLKGLAKIRAKAATNGYRGEYEFQVELDALARTVKDGHVNMAMDVITIFTFLRSKIGPIVSISEDGKSMPKIFSFNDLKGRTEKPSAIKTIDDKDATQWLRDYSYQGTSQDPDALFNSLLYRLPPTKSSSGGSFLGSLSISTGPYTKLGFENGTMTKYENVATFAADFTRVKDGASFYENFCNITLPDARRTEIFEEDSNKIYVGDDMFEVADVEDPHEPMEPVVKTRDGQVAGYFLGGEHSNTAVLTFRSFSSETVAGIREFSQAIETFLDQCRSAKKQKLIVDVSGNGGGIIFLGYEAFKHLLPYGKITTPMNLPATEQFDTVGRIVTDLINNPKASPELVRAEKNRLFDTNTYVNSDYKKFKSWAEYFGPEGVGHYNFTLPAFWDFENVPASMNSGGIVVYGHATRPVKAPQPFGIEDIVLLTDGICASTCAVFADLLNRHGVKSIAISGNPRPNRMQAVGGVKGAQVLSYRALWRVAARTLTRYITPEQLEKMKGNKLVEMFEKGRHVLPRLLRTGEGGRINYRNAIYTEDKDRIPRQFIYEPADCKVWFTRDTVLDPLKWWGSIAKTWWGRRGECPMGGPNSPS
ncbi:hypothetical protein LOZ64_001622 [Ophidiomyces ophidiicola]|nr:hypothetical protein LOZ64_001622 [Ophidiomyces ophidiicola]KAI2006479.1 hypothetical protein LOZ49_005010 [Ophidiomyces ophidiicola]KAI2023252.1 hypothetical protein LOZ46_001583 [Ophidiomyces ophidiicola]KAI2140993.1 hypothetical protein LOZ29_001952 [Ophidiomyces ophidiicola]KAI2142548.1 hypothetical protein LOZ28_002083 [Ophidiomyces ophidiicola]